MIFMKSNARGTKEGIATFLKMRSPFFLGKEDVQVFEIRSVLKPI